MAVSLRRGAPRALLAFCLMTMFGLLAPATAFAQNAGEAQLAGRVQDLEQQVRDLTGQVQGLQFTLTQMQQQLQKMQDDNEFRFQQLEGGGGKKPTTKSSATPTNVAPQGAAMPDATLAVPAPAPLTGGKQTQSTTAKSADTQPSDGLGDSQDPLLGKAGTQSQATLGTLPAGQDGKGLDLTLKSGEAISGGDAQAQYKAGYDAITRGDYAFAADQFKQFIALYPKDPQAPDAANWLGEALLQQQSYDDAADVLLSGFQNYQNSPRAPDLLLKLGIALSGAGEQDTACRTFFEVAKRYPKQPQAFLQRLQDEKAKAKCPV